LPSEPITSQTGGAAQSATDKNRTDKFEHAAQNNQCDCDA